jgi:hypothetical protein
MEIFFCDLDLYLATQQGMVERNIPSATSIITVADRNTLLNRPELDLCAEL